MLFTAEYQVKTLTQALSEKFYAKFPPEEAQKLTQFAQHFMRFIAPEDLLARGDRENLYAALLDYWHFFAQFSGDKPKIRVYNPRFEQHGWQSSHTVVSVLSRDLPFLIDSLRMLLNRRGLTVHLIVHPMLKVARDEAGLIKDWQPSKDCPSGWEETLVHLEMDRQTESAVLHSIQQAIAQLLDTLQSCFSDWTLMQAKMREVMTQLDVYATERDFAETQAFLNWLCDGHFIFLGAREYRLQHDHEDLSLWVLPASGLGVLRETCAEPSRSNATQPRRSRSFDALPRVLREQAADPRLMLFSKSSHKAPIHRDTYMDSISIRHFDEHGEVRGEWRFLGLYTAAFYHLSVQDIPLLRERLQRVLEKSAYPPKSHGANTLSNILETYPRDEMLQTDEDALLDIALGIARLRERQRTRVFVRPDKFGRFFTCIVYVARERYDTAIRKRMQQVLLQAFEGDSVEFNVTLSESLLAQVHFIIRMPAASQDLEGLSKHLPQYDIEQIEQQLSEVTRDWRDRLYDTLLEHYGEEQGTQLARRFEDAFPVAYREDFLPRQAAYDIEKIQALNDEQALAMHLYRPPEADNGSLRFKLFHAKAHISLSDVLPMLENMGVKVLSERSYAIRGGSERGRYPFSEKKGSVPLLLSVPLFWIQEFDLQSESAQETDIEALQNRFQDSFAQIWHGQVENDGFNRLVLQARLGAREISIFRAYDRYLRQLGGGFSATYTENTLAKHGEIVRLLLRLFYARLHPQKSNDTHCTALLDNLNNKLESVESLDEDRILRRFLGVIQATLRTNYFQTAGVSNRSLTQKDYIAFKLNPQQVPDMPSPKPMFEIFVYSPRVEGVHLRGGKVARGGLRWSDRREDFRTEILGLVKAQIVKNAVIVPVGSKGGFVAKRLPSLIAQGGGREAIQAEGIACYQTFIRGLLDVTDNLVDGEIQPPPEVVRHDADDPYLVVAADKGTATFSDIANKISAEYHFWLGDAFASGGSAGYDHKKMGITARGAWVSVMRHFRETHLDTQSQDFTAIGIGDMAGDVFGNGLLRSKHTRLVAAFNHLHIFLDPNPDAKASFAERKRLFKLPRSTWEDYDKGLISQGGGVFSRRQKSIAISSEVAQLLDIKDSHLPPNELIKAILRAPVDLLWNGGIGTYVKASSEHHNEVGDKANDSLRVNGCELRCKVVGEGGNLGFTQLGRIEYALHGGRINTDAIDNSGGVNCSDQEVNIKILLNQIVHKADMTGKQRDHLLLEMTERVATRVLHNNYLQTQALSIAESVAPQMLDVHTRFMKELEKAGRLDRALEFLPDDETLSARRANGQGLTRPELSVLLAYSKIALFDELLDSNLPEDATLESLLLHYFPDPLPQRFKEDIRAHRLHREIIATELTNQVINRAGAMFVFMLQEETGLSSADIVRAYWIAAEVFELHSVWTAIEALDNQVAAAVQIRMMREVIKLGERAARWLLRSRSLPLDIAENIALFAAGRGGHPLDTAGQADQEHAQALAAELMQAGVPEDLAQGVGGLNIQLARLDITLVSQDTDTPLANTAEIYFALSERLSLHWLRDRIAELPRNNRWNSLSRAALRDEFYRTHRALTTAVLATDSPSHATTAKLATWLEKHELAVQRYEQVMAELSSANNADLAMLSVALREASFSHAPVSRK